MTTRYLSTIILLASASAVSSCGGGGEVNSAGTTPPPVTPGTPSSPPPASISITTFAAPATRAGTYDMIALLDQAGPVPGTAVNRLTSPGEFRITTYQPTQNANELSYTLWLPAIDGSSTMTALFPPRAVDTPVGPITERFGDQFTYTSGTWTGGGSRLIDHSTVASRDTGGGKTFNSQLDYSAGLSYVSLGQWNWWISDNATGNTEEYTSLYFVHGDRTPAGDVPASGTATYSGQSLGYSTDAVDRGSAYGAPIDVSLAADFGQRSIAAQLSRDAQTSGDQIGGVTTVASVDLHGAGSITTGGSFAVPLTGTVNTTPVAGALDGAFFGPNAEQVGGVFSVGDTAGQALVRDAFVGLRN